MTPQYFCELIKNNRIKQRLTQKQLGDKCGLKQQYIYLIEHNQVSPSLTTIIKILNALNLTMEII